MANGVDALTGLEKTMSEGLSVPVGVPPGKLGGHSGCVMRLEFRAKQAGMERNPDAVVYVQVVKTTAPTDEVEAELTLPAGAYTVQAKANQ